MKPIAFVIWVLCMICSPVMVILAVMVSRRDYAQAAYLMALAVVLRCNANDLGAILR